MHIIDYLTRDRVEARARCKDSHDLLAQAAHKLAADDDAALLAPILAALEAREALGSTGLGCGVALPHARLGVDSEPVAAFLQLRPAVDFAAQDGVAVDLVLALIIPERFSDAHLTLLAQTAELMSNPDVLADLRAATDSRQLYDRLHKHCVALGEA